MTDRFIPTPEDVDPVTTHSKRIVTRLVGAAQLTSISPSVSFSDRNTRKTYSLSFGQRRENVLLLRLTTENQTPSINVLEDASINLYDKKDGTMEGHFRYNVSRKRPSSPTVIEEDTCSEWAFRGIEKLTSEIEDLVR